MPTGQATSDRALATLNKFYPQELLARGGSGLWPSFSTWYAGARALGVMRRREHLVGPDRTPIDAAA